MGAKPSPLGEDFGSIFCPKGEGEKVKATRIKGK